MLKALREIHSLVVELRNLQRCIAMSLKPHQARRLECKTNAIVLCLEELEARLRRQAKSEPDDVRAVYEEDRRRH